MVKYSELESIFSQSNLTIYEYNLETDEEIELPYLVYEAQAGESFSADGVVYYQTLSIALAIIDETLNFPIQRQVEDVLINNGVFFEKNINFDEGPRLYVISYSFFVEDDGIS